AYRNGGALRVSLHRCSYLRSGPREAINTERHVAPRRPLRPFRAEPAAPARCLQAACRAVPHQEAFTEAKASALRALAMDSASADAQVALGTVLFLSEWDWGGAERGLRRGGGR